MHKVCTTGPPQIANYHLINGTSYTLKVMGVFKELDNDVGIGKIYFQSVKDKNSRICAQH